MTRSLGRILFVGLLLAAAGGAQAAVTCSVAAGTLAFGVFNGSQNNSSVLMTISCDRPWLDIFPVTIGYTASLSPGSSGTFAQRKLVGPGGDTLNYNLYPNTVPGVLNTNVWGDGTGGTSQVSGGLSWTWFEGGLKTSTPTIAGAIAASALPSAGSYGDTILVTLVYN